MCVYFLWQNNAEVAVRDMMKDIARDVQSRTGTTRLSATDQMDDGSPIKLTVDIDASEVGHKYSYAFVRFIVWYSTSTIVGCILFN